MRNLPLAIPPGVFRQGAEYQSRGRWWDANLVRHYGRQVGPIGGWRPRAAGQVAVTGAARALLAWRTTSNNRWIGIGTHSNLYAQDASGDNHDITPAAFVVGAENEGPNTGFGSGLYGAGEYGTPRDDTGNPLVATVWDLDNFGNDLVGTAASDGRLFIWEQDPAVIAAPITDAPTSCAGVVVTPDSFVMALGAGGDPRKVQWSDQGIADSWTPSTVSQAGDIDLVTSGAIRKGVRTGAVVLILTDLDAHVAEYVGLPSVYRFSQIGSGCGAISKGCVVSTGNQAVWWSASGFWIFDGQSAVPLPCDVFAFLQANLNMGQQSKVTGFHNAGNGEVTFFYPSAGATENDSYVTWAYRASAELGSPVWWIGLLARLSACEPSVFQLPLAMGADGICYEHEIGTSYDGAAPFVESGPIQLGDGDQSLRVLGIIPDEAQAGQATVTFKTRPWPNADETVLAAISFDGSGQQSIRFEARQVKMRVSFEADAAGARWGEARLMAQPGGRR